MPDPETSAIAPAMAVNHEQKFNQKAAARYLFGDDGGERTLEGWRLRGGGPDT